MKSSYLSYYLFILLLVSCKPKYLKTIDKLSGNWVLSQFEYVDDNNRPYSDSNGAYTITFFKDLKEGNLLINNNKISFMYDFGYEFFDTGYAYCDIKMQEIDSLPLNGLGKVQVYFYKFIDKNTLEIKANNELWISENKYLRNVKYIFKKL